MPPAPLVVPAPPELDAAPTLLLVVGATDVLLSPELLVLPKLLLVAPPALAEAVDIVDVPVSVPLTVPTLGPAASDDSVFPVVVGSVAMVLSEASPEVPHPAPQSSPTSRSGTFRSM